MDQDTLGESHKEKKGSSDIWRNNDRKLPKFEERHESKFKKLNDLQVKRTQRNLRTTLRNYHQTIRRRKQRQMLKARQKCFIWKWSSRLSIKFLIRNSGRQEAVRKIHLKYWKKKTKPRIPYLSLSFQKKISRNKSWESSLPLHLPYKW